ncbi:MAG: hypothetical protein KDM63_02395 [Verrucomicrobiae bacterium]|nr:hypothetical protein [Verrucomicrobiae bacterium]MCB1090049.1 hypothetical protein [Verrucomicrobiae bacterium]
MERRSLAEHARREGCRLIIDAPEYYTRVHGRYGPDNAKIRARGLLAFLEGTEVLDIHVAVSDDPERKSSVTLVGDWFFSEAISSGEIANLREAILTRDAASVQREITKFDIEFEILLTGRG